MTVCIAALTTLNGWPVIVGATDLMRTAGDMQYQPFVPKRYHLTDRILAMGAGTSTIQAELFASTFREVAAQKVTEVRGVADIYATCFTELRTQQSEAALLKPLKLSIDEWLDRLASFPTSFNTQIVAELRSNDWELDAAAIICGVDGTGPHLFTATDPGEVRPFDGIGYTAIGSGARHALSVLRLNGQNPKYAFAATLLNVYQAKKRAELDPFVGPITDLFLIGSWPPYFAAPDYGWIQQLDNAYWGAVAKEREAWAKALEVINEYVNQQLPPPPPPPAEPPAMPPEVKPNDDALLTDED
jgi:20S proteasome alpha/beta subunit